MPLWNSSESYVIVRRAWGILVRGVGFFSVVSTKFFTWFVVADTVQREEIASFNYTSMLLPFTRLWKLLWKPCRVGTVAA